MAVVQASGGESTDRIAQHIAQGAKFTNFEMRIGPQFSLV